MTINLKNIVSKQIPEFAREDYPLFVAFVEAYYDYLGQQEKRDLTDIRDLDQTLDEYIQFFKKELDVFGDNYEFINQRFLLRKVKQLFVSKGVESSYKFLIKLLFDKVAEVSYPWDSVLKASDGKWQQEMSVFTRITAGDPNTLVGNRIDVLSTNLVIKVYVERVRYVEENIWEIFINKNYYGNIKVDYTVSFNGVTGTIIPTTISYTIVKPGSGYKVGQLITGTTIANGKRMPQLLKITRVDENGGVLNIATIQFGYNYDTNFYLLKSNDPVSTNSLLTINRDSVQQYSILNDSKIDYYDDYGYVSSPDYAELDFADQTYAATFLQQFYEESLSGQGPDPDYLLIRFDIGAVAKYQGHYNSNDGFLDDDIFIQDSYRWQKYSYVIRVNEKLDKYKSLIKSYIHPAGTALFGEYQIQNTYVPGISASLELGQWTSLATFTVINKAISNDFIYSTDMGGQIRIDPYDLEDYFTADEFYNPPVSISFFGDGRNNLTSTNLTISDAAPSLVVT
jgi:hypothetical protein